MPERSCDVFHQVGAFGACAQVEQHVANIELRLLGKVRHRGFDHAVQDKDQIGDFRAHFDVVGQSESSMGCVRATMVGQAGRSDNRPARKGGHAPAGQTYAPSAPAYAVEPVRDPFPSTYAIGHRPYG